MKITTPEDIYEVDQTNTPEEREKWQRDLALVYCGMPNPLLGIALRDRRTEELTVYGALLHISRLDMVPVHENPNQFRLQLTVRILAPLDLTAPATVEVINPATILYIKDQPPESREWYYQNYLNALAPPRVVLAAQVPPLKM